MVLTGGSTGIVVLPTKYETKEQCEAAATEENEAIPGWLYRFCVKAGENK